MWNSLETQGKKLHQWNKFELYSIYLIYQLERRLIQECRTFLKINQITLATNFTFIKFGLYHHTPTKHTSQTPKGNAHTETATIKNIILKCLQPIGTQMAAAGHLAF